MTKQEYQTLKKQIDNAIQRIEEEALNEGMIISAQDITAFKRKFLAKKGFTLEEYEQIELITTEKEEDNINISIESAPGLQAKITKSINAVESKIPSKEDIVKIVKENLPKPQKILTKEDVQKMIPESSEHVQTIKDLNEAKKERDELRNAMEKLDKKKLKVKIKKRDLSDFVKRTDLNAFVKTDEVIKLQQRLKRLPTEAAAPALFRIDDLISKLNASPVDLSSQCDGSNTTFDTPSDIQGIMWVYLNGAFLAEGNEFTRTGSRTITLTFAPDNGEKLYIKYISA